MTENDKTLAAICAELLDTAKFIVLFQTVIFVAHLVIMLKYGFVLSGATACLLMLGIVYFGIRLALDVTIFRAFSQEKYTPQAFDQALATALNRPSNKPRDMTNRCHAAMRLYRKLILLSLVQTGLLFICLLTLALL